MKTTKQKAVDAADERADVAFTRMLDLIEATSLSEGTKAAILYRVRDYINATSEFIRITLKMED